MLTPRVVTAVAVFVASFLFRLSTFSITDDDYLHLSLAQQVLLGDVPIRDFIDPGEPFFYYLSAAVQFVFGRHLLSEVLLDVLLLSVGYTLVFLLAYEATRSCALGALVTTIAVMLLPRLYSFPKIVLYGVALSLMWRYVDLQRRRNLIMLAICTAVAFLFRHDHGVYIGCASCVMLGITHWRQGWRQVSRAVAYFGTATALLVLPFFIFVQLNGGIVDYWRNTVATAQAERNRTEGPLPRFQPTLASPLIRIRWAAGVDEPARLALEGRFHLAAPEYRGEDDVYPGEEQWQYDLTDASSENIAALVRDPNVADTDGLDRSLFVVTAYVLDPNVLAWFYYLTISLPALTIIVLVLQGRASSKYSTENTQPKIAAAAVLAGLMHPFLLRAASESAIADVSTPTAVLGAWLLARGLTPWDWRAGWPLLRTALTAAVLLVTLAATERGPGWHSLRTLIATLQQGAIEPIVDRIAALRQSVAPFPGDGARYVFDCTEASDRLLVTGYAPHVHYRSGRGFAAGRPYFLGSFAPLQMSESFSLRQLMSERVPIVLATGEPGRWFPTTPLIDAYLRWHYRQVGEILFSDTMYAVLTDQRLQPVSSYGPASLPCFRAGDRQAIP